MKNTSGWSAYYAVGAHTPEQVLAFHRATFGDARMEAEQGSDSPAAEKPEGVSDAEWDALGDPGKQALVRERQARADLEAQLAEARKPKPSPPAQKTGEEKAALAPVQESQQQWQAEQLAARVRESVTTTAAARFHDVSDVMPHLDLTQLTDGSGAPDQSKIVAELERVAADKPHLVKPAYAPRTPMPGAPFGGGASAPSIDERVKESLARMQTAAGVHKGAAA